MHHWADATAGEAEIGRVLRPGGRALIWDIRAGVVPLHRRQPDPLDKVASSPLRLASGTGMLERETGFEPATFCLGSPELVSVVA
jgi:SAM-dependent methyltransferase